MIGRSRSGARTPKRPEFELVALLLGLKDVTALLPPTSYLLDSYGQPVGFQGDLRARHEFHTYTHVRAKCKLLLIGKVRPEIGALW